MKAKDTSSNEQTDAQTNGELPPVTPPTPRPVPKRKFAIRLGSMNFEKRCTVKEMAATIAATQGAKAYLEIDGYSFEFREEAITSPEPTLAVE